MTRSIYKVSRNLARRQLAGKDIRSKIESECKYNNWNVSQMKKLVAEYYSIELHKNPREH